MSQWWRDFFAVFVVLVSFGAYISFGYWMIQTHNLVGSIVAIFIGVVGASALAATIMR